MSKATLAVKVDYKTVNKVKKFCRERGIKYGFFVERALEERLEREELKEDLLDLKTYIHTDVQFDEKLLFL